MTSKCLLIALSIDYGRKSHLGLWNRVFVTKRHKQHNTIEESSTAPLFIWKFVHGSLSFSVVWMQSRCTFARVPQARGHRYTILNVHFPGKQPAALANKTLKSSFGQGAFSLKPRAFSREQLKFTKSLVSGDWKQELDSGLLFCPENRHNDLSLFSYVLGVTSFFWFTKLLKPHACSDFVQ